MKIASPPSARTIAAVSAPILGSMSTHAMAAPSRANNRLAARPTPEAAPVITAFFPTSRGIRLYSSSPNCWRSSVHERILANGRQGACDCLYTPFVHGLYRFGPGNVPG